MLRGYQRVIVPEMNLGQLAMLLRAKYLVDIESHTSVRGLPFQAGELADVIADRRGVRLGRVREGDRPVTTDLGMPTHGGSAPVDSRDASSATAPPACPASATARR